MKNNQNWEDLPYSQEAEQSVLGAIILKSSYLNTVLEVIPNSDFFYFPNNKIIYETIINMFSSGEKIDYVTVLNKIPVDIAAKNEFKNHRNASLILSNFLTIAIEKKFKNQKFDSITFVPCYHSDEKYNHSEILAEKISENLGIPLKKHLKKIRENKKQHRLSFSERQENVKGVYQCVEENLQNKNILICDDIITTGATLSECAKELEKSGAKVFCSTVAYTILKTLE